MIGNQVKNHYNGRCEPSMQYIGIDKDKELEPNEEHNEDNAKPFIPGFFCWVTSEFKYRGIPLDKISRIDLDFTETGDITLIDVNVHGKRYTLHDSVAVRFMEELRKYNESL